MASIISASTTSGTALNMSADTTGILQLATGATPTTAVTIDTLQNVGIGVTPSAWGTAFSQKALQISSAGSISGLNASTGNQQINMANNVYFDGTNWKYITSDGAILYTQVTAGLHQWFNASSGTAGNTVTFSERMRIDSSGNLLVGTTSNSYSGKQVISFDNASIRGTNYQMTSTSYNQESIAFWNPAGTRVGYIFANGSGTSYVTSSDYRLKENVLPMVGALETIAQLKPVTYDWISDKSQGQGFIAHELQAVVPDCVTGEKDAVDADGNPQYQGIDTSFLVATLTAAIQEQQTIINDLKARVETLEAK
jgi:hypothetical protein